MSLLFKLSYGVYVLSVKEGDKQNGCIINTVMQQTAIPMEEKLSVTINKGSLTHDMLLRTGRCVANILDNTATFDLIKNFGMQSGKSGVDKFDKIPCQLSTNGIKALTEHSCGYFELKVVNTVDLGTHTIFICEIIEERKFDKADEPLTYSYYQEYIKPKPQPAPAEDEAWECNVCGYVHKGPLPDDFVCPLCKHGAKDFSKIS